MGAGRIALAEVALNNLIMDVVKESAAEGTGSHAGHALDTTFQIEFHCAGFLITPEGIKEA